MIRKLAFALLLVTGLFACSKDTEQQKSSDLKTSQLIQTAWLNQQLPDSALAYVRIPNPWFPLIAQQNGFEFAQANIQHNQQIELIRKAVLDNLVKASGGQNQEAFELLLSNMVAPLEVALLQERAGQMMPISVFATRFNFSNLSEFNSAFSQLIKQVPIIRELKPMDQTGIGELNIQGMNASYQYDVASGNFKMLVGMFDMSSIRKVAKTLVANQDHAMQALEAQIDTSGQGLFVWANGKEVMPMLEMMLPPSKVTMINEFELEKMNAFAIGYGSAEHKTRLRAVFDMPRVGVREFLPAVNNQFELDTVGQPKTFALFSLPTAKELESIVKRAASKDGVDPNQAWTEMATDFKQATDIELKNALNMVGPEIIYFRDTVGPFLAFKLKRKNELMSFIKQAETGGFAKYKTHVKNGVNVHHITFNFLPEEGTGIFGKSPKMTFLSLLSRINTHLYWIEQDGYALVSTVPQPLLERVKKGADTGLAQWVKERQGQNIAHSLFAINGSFEDLSRNSYHYYLELLTLLADLSDSEIDIMALPTADELGFADKGAIGFQVDSNENYLALEFTFEQSVTDLIHAGGTMQMVAVVGVLSAIAIPAYQDYVVRSEIAAKAASNDNYYKVTEPPLEEAEMLEVYESVEEVEEIIEDTDQ